MQLYPVTTYKRTTVGLIVCTQYFSSSLCGRNSVKCNSLCFDGCMYPTRCPAPLVVASHLCLESGATDRPVSSTQQVPTTGGVCVPSVCSGIT